MKQVAKVIVAASISLFFMAGSVYASGGGGHAASSGHGEGHEVINVKPKSISIIDAATLKKLDEARHHKIDHSLLVSLDHGGEEGSNLFIFGAAGALALVLAAVVLGKTGVLNNLRLAKKLYAGFGVVVLLSLVIGLTNRYFIGIVAHESHMAEEFLHADALTGKLTTLQNEFLLIGIQDKERGEEILEEHRKITGEFHAILDELTSVDMHGDELEAIKAILASNEKYEAIFADLVEKYHAIEEEKVELEHHAELMAHEIEQIIHEQEAELAELEKSGAPMDTIIFHTQLVEKLVELEILELKISNDEVGFMLD